MKEILLAFGLCVIAVPASAQCVCGQPGYGQQYPYYGTGYRHDWGQPGYGIGGNVGVGAPGVGIGYGDRGQDRRTARRVYRRHNDNLVGGADSGIRQP